MYIYIYVYKLYIYIVYIYIYIICVHTSHLYTESRRIQFSHDRNKNPKVSPPRDNMQYGNTSQFPTVPSVEPWGYQWLS